MADLQARYENLIKRIVQSSLNGETPSRDQVYALINRELEPQTDAIFSACLNHWLVYPAMHIEAPDFPPNRHLDFTLQTLKTIHREWRRYQQAMRNQDIVVKTIFQIAHAEPYEQLAILIPIIRPNHDGKLSLSLLEQLAQGLASSPCDGSTQRVLQEYARGIQQGLQSWKAIESHLVSWLYNKPSAADQAATSANSPWQLWSKQAIRPLLKSLFEALHAQASLESWVVNCTDFTLSDWVELVLVLQTAQLNLLRWANQQPYEATAKQQLLNSLDLGFASTWAQLGRGIKRCHSLNHLNCEQFSQVALQLSLQFLSKFTQQSKFSLYPNISQPTKPQLYQSLRYLSKALQPLDAQPAQGRVLMVMGNFVLVYGKYAEAEKLYRQALKIAQATSDTTGIIANLNHLSRIATIQDKYAMAITHAQRALIFARQVGDPQGEANALMNLGTASVQKAQLMSAPIEHHATAMMYLSEAIAKARQLGDQQCEGICANAIANICLHINHPAEALNWLQTGCKATHTGGDFYLRAHYFTNMATACQQMDHPRDAIYAACVGLYYFDQINCRNWRQPAALLHQLKQRLENRFDQLLAQELTAIVQQIGAQGFAQIKHRLGQFEQTTS